MRLKDLLTTAGLAALSFLVCEGLVRLYLRSHLVYDIEMTRYSSLLKMKSDDPRIVFEHRPSASATLMGVPVVINSDGMRDREYPLARSRARRLIFLGDSLTLGWGVEKDKTFEELLESRMNAKSPTEILNMGTGNYNTVQETELFFKKGLKYSPDEVVVFYFINDPEPLPGDVRIESLGRSQLLAAFLALSHAMIDRYGRPLGYREYYASLYKDGAPGWEAAKDAFLRLKRVCDERKMALKIVVLPELHDITDYPFRREHALLAKFAEDNRIALLDLLPAFAGHPRPSDLWVAPDDAHPNAAAHAIIAEAAGAFLAKR